MAGDKLALYSYFRSSCSWRVRIALELKNLPYEYRAVHLVRDGGEQNKAEFRAVNPLGQVPALVHGDDKDSPVVVTQSATIMEYLDEAFPDTYRLVPKDLHQRTKVREITEMIVSGIQPLQNLAVMNMAREDPEGRIQWSKYWVDNGLRAVEKMLEKSAGRFCVGDSISMADLCLVPQVYHAAVRFNVDLSQYPIMSRITKDLESMDAFKKAHPNACPDCPPEN